MISQNELLQLNSLALDETNLPLQGKQSGKVRDWYDLPNGKRLIVTTDRLSAFDRNLACVPYKGQALNQLSAWWFKQTEDIIPNHLVSIPDPNAAIVRRVAAHSGRGHRARIHHRRYIHRVMVSLLAGRA